MAKFFPALDDNLKAFIARQHIFFVATAPNDGRISLSPKGLDSLRVLDDKRIAYLDLTGSGNETAAHLLADGRMTMMFCSFEGDHLILRLYGKGRSIKPSDAEMDRELSPRFPTLPGARQIILLEIESLQTSCGAGVPLYAYTGEREALLRWVTKKGEAGVREYQHEKNRLSIDGLPTGLFEEGNTMKHIGLIAMLLATALLAACEEKPYQPPVPRAEPDKPAAKLFEPQRETLDKAKSVEKALEQAAQAQNKAVEKAAQ